MTRLFMIISIIWILQTIPLFLLTVHLWVQYFLIMYRQMKGKYSSWSLTWTTEPVTKAVQIFKLWLRKAKKKNDRKEKEKKKKLKEREARQVRPGAECECVCVQGSEGLPSQRTLSPTEQQRWITYSCPLRLSSHKRLTFKDKSGEINLLYRGYKSETLHLGSADTRRMVYTLHNFFFFFSFFF